MRRTLLLTDDPIDEPALVAGRPVSAGMGAAIVFSGVVRGSEDGSPIGAIGYEGFRTMVERQFGLLFDEMERRWPVGSVRLVHRLGVVKVGEPSVEDTIAILRGLKERYEVHHGVRIQDGAIVAAATR